MPFLLGTKRWQEKDISTPLNVRRQILALSFPANALPHTHDIICCTEDSNFIPHSNIHLSIQKKSSTKLNFELVTQIYMCTRMDKYVDTYLVRCMDKQSTQAAAALNSGTSNNSEGLILSLSYKKNLII